LSGGGGGGNGSTTWLENKLLLQLAVPVLAVSLAVLGFLFSRWMASVDASIDTLAHQFETIERSVDKLTWTSEQNYKNLDAMQRDLSGLKAEEKAQHEVERGLKNTE
jgi:uncharacterized protein YoxC